MTLSYQRKRLADFAAGIRLSRDARGARALAA